MNDETTDERGFISRQGGDAWGTSEPPPQAEQTPEPTEPAPTFGTVSQGVGLNEDTRHPLDLSRLSDHTYWLANRQAFLDAAAAGELTNP